MLNDWIYSIGGADVLAKKLKMTPHAVRVWMRGEGCPRPPHMKRIVALSKGAVTFQDLVNASQGSQGKNLSRCSTK